MFIPQFRLKNISCVRCRLCIEFPLIHRFRWLQDFIAIKLTTILNIKWPINIVASLIYDYITDTQRNRLSVFMAMVLSMDFQRFRKILENSSRAVQILRVSTLISNFTEIIRTGNSFLYIQIFPCSALLVFVLTCQEKC